MSDDTKKQAVEIVKAIHSKAGINGVAALYTGRPHLTLRAYALPLRNAIVETARDFCVVGTW